MEYIRVEQTIAALHERTPVTFAHLYTESSPLEHALHMNDYVELYVYVSGDVHYVIEDRYYELKKYDFLLIPPHSTHTPVIKKSGMYERFYLLLPLDTFASYVDAPLQRLLQLCAKEPRMHLLPEVKEQAVRLLYQMSALCREGTAGLLSVQLHAMVLALLSLLYSGCGERESAIQPASLPPLIRDALAYIAAHATQIESVAALAAHLYVSSPYLCSLFKQHVGITVNGYLRAKKISAAKIMLAQGCSVAYACYECGFNDSSYFIKVFRRCGGMTPRQYRKYYGESSPDAQPER
jgi:AraC-like DNA-binding protein